MSNETYLLERLDSAEGFLENALLIVRAAKKVKDKRKSLIRSAIHSTAGADSALLTAYRKHQG